MSGSKRIYGGVLYDDNESRAAMKKAKKDYPAREGQPSDGCRYFIEEEARWMEPWEEWKYTLKASYFREHNPSYFHLANSHICITCCCSPDEHVRNYMIDEEGKTYYTLDCTNRIVRSYFNKYTGIRIGWPVLLDRYEVFEGRYTQ